VISKQLGIILDGDQLLDRDQAVLVRLSK